MSLDPVLTPIAIGLEVVILGQALRCFRATIRHDTRASEFVHALDEGVDALVRPRLERVIVRVIRLRRPAVATEDGEAPEEPLQDVLIRADLHKDCEDLMEALDESNKPLKMSRAVMGIELAQGVALLVAAIALVPLAWQLLADRSIMGIQDATYHIVNTVLAISAAASVSLLALGLIFEARLSRCLHRFDRRRGQIGR